MANFRELRKNPNHPFWAFIEQLDADSKTNNTNNNNNNNNVPESSGTIREKGKEKAVDPPIEIPVDRDATPNLKPAHQEAPWEYVNEKDGDVEITRDFTEPPPPNFEEATSQDKKSAEAEVVPLDETSDSDDDEEDDEEAIYKDDPMRVDETPEQKASRREARQARQKARAERRQARHAMRKERRDFNRQTREQAKIHREIRREQWKNLRAEDQQEPQEPFGASPFHGPGGVRGGPGVGPHGGRRGHHHHGPHHHGPHPQGPHHHGGPPPFRGPFGGMRGRMGGMRGGFGGPPHDRRRPGFPFGGGPNAPPFDLPAIAGWIQNMFIDPRQQQQTKQQQSRESDFTPAVDVFSTVEAYLVQVSLPGAKKSDISVNWSAETSSLIVSGVIIANDTENMVRISSERQIGVFERRIVLGSTDEYVKIWDEAISARLEEGVLHIEVPKYQDEKAGLKDDVKKVPIS